MTWLTQKWHNFLKLPHRLSPLFLAMIAVWLVCGILLIGISLHLSWRLEERGITINEVGNLRKQCFHMYLLSRTGNQELMLQEHEEFMKIFNKISLFTQRKFHNKAQYQKFMTQLIVVKQKALMILPHFSENNPQNDTLTLEIITDFVESISHLVDIVEQDNTDRIVLLRWLQVVILMIALGASIFSFIFLRRLVVYPLHRLSSGIQQVRNGNFNAPVPIHLNNELGEITAGFNQMSQELGRMYQYLEKLVDDKTEELQKKHSNLSFLYRVSSLLQGSKDIDFIATHFLQLIMDFTKAKGGIIRLLNPSKDSTEIIASKGFEDEVLNAEQCTDLKDCFCGIALLKKKKIFQQSLTSDSNIEALCQKSHLNHLVSFKLSMNEVTLGSLNLFFKEKGDYIAEDSPIIENAVRQFGLVLDSLRVEQLEIQMFVLEERNFMAQGLHDSIAQSLSFLNMQTQLLSKAIANNQTTIRDQSLSFIKEGIQESYDNVRELLLNFRVSLNPGNFADSIQNVINRFKRQTNIAIEFEYIDQGRELSPEKQLQVIFILQEALSNIRKHAEASLVSIHIEQYQDRFTLKVTDNGKGFNEDILTDKKDAGHIGTLIMKERAAKANGSVTIQSQINQGTSLLLEIQRKNIIHERNQ